MATATPGGSPLFPGGQKREQFGRDWGNYGTVAGMPNGSGNILTADQFRLEAGDRCYLTLSGSEGEYLCVSAGSATLGDAVWIPNTGRGPWSSVLYVDSVRGSDATGQRGNANRPFATPQAAINAAQTADTVQLAAQRFLLTVALTIPATVVTLSITGVVYGPQISTAAASLSITALRNVTTHLFDLGANLGLAGLVLNNLDLVTVGGGLNTIQADGSAYAATTFLAGAGLILNDCTVSSTSLGFNLKYVVFARMYQTMCSAPCSFINGFVLTFIRSGFSTALITCTSDLADPLTPAFQPQLNVTAGSVVGGGSSTGYILMGGQVALVVDGNSLIGGLVGSNLSVHAGPTAVPSVLCKGTIAGAHAGNIDFRTAGSELPDTATVLSFDFRGTRFLTDNNTPTIQFKVGGAGANFQTVRLDSAVAAPTGATVVAGAKIHLSARGASFPVASYLTPDADGDIVPPPFTTGPTALASIAQVVSFGFRLAASTFMVAPDLDDSTAVYQSVTNRTTTGYTVNVAVAAGNFRGLVTYMG